METLHLLGRSEEEVKQYLSLHYPQQKWQIVSTRSPFWGEREQEKASGLEKRVIRLKKNDDSLEILVGYFRLSDVMR
ncbi:MAG TPA: hypothetical protein PLJ33_01055 [Peptococcaceae bacterium]|nr:hypothetical protein [Clostridia bacterium]HOB81339.1 hypothetical protein [Peptococcaceae bacterium]HPZ70615.1 hypothetical protein [Peptococcaceae bacterium]HQD53425.1 hypothetical protein [Peptococcaceae bacterium]